MFSQVNKQLNYMQKIWFYLMNLIRMFSMNKQQRRMIAELDETIAYYNRDPSRRAAVNYGCHYHTPDGKMCAVGRRCINAQEVELSGGTACDLDKKFNGLDNLLRPEHRGLPVNFWRAMQLIHDRDQYWTSTGLNAYGKLIVQSLRNAILNKVIYQERYDWERQ